MKKLLTCFLACALLVSMAACSSNEQSDADPTTTTTSASQATTTTTMDPNLLIPNVAPPGLTTATTTGKTVSNKTEVSTDPGTEPEDTPHSEEKELEIYAYAGPRGGGYRWKVGNQVHPDDPVGGWSGFITRKDFQDYIDCGFTFLYPEYDAQPYTNVAGNTVPFEYSSLYEYMRLAEQMDLDVIVHSYKLTDIASSTQSTLKAEDKTYLSTLIADLSAFDCFRGLTVRDEPKDKNYVMFEQITNYARSVKSDIEFMTAMLPVYGTHMLNNNAGTLTDYEKYIAAYGKLDGHFVYDFYPLRWSPTSGNYLTKQWFQNLELVAASGKRNHFDTGVIIQSCAYGPVGGYGVTDHARSITTKADVGYQLYSALAYGAKTIGYFTYWQHRTEGHPHITESFYDGMVMYPEKNGQPSVKTDAYYAVKAANLEVKKFDHVLMNFDWEGTMALKGGDKFNTLSYISDYRSPRIASATSTEDAIIGCLKDQNGNDGFMLVNALEPSLSKSVSVTVKFRDANAATAYIEGNETTLTLKDGSYTFTLPAGAGVFVIPYKK